MKHILQKKYQSGHAMMLVVLFSILLSLIIAAGLLFPALVGARNATDLWHSKKSFFLAEAAVEDAVYRLKNGYQVLSGEILQIDGRQAEISVNDTDTGKLVGVVGDWQNSLRYLEARLIIGEGAAFFYGVQAGDGGFLIEGGSIVNGNVYSNGDIWGNGGAVITGSAIAATLNPPSLDQANEPIFPPPAEINFGGNGIPQDLAQSFTVSNSDEISSFKLYLKRSSSDWMNNITARITNDGSGGPGGTILATAPINHQDVSTSYNYVTITFDGLSLNPGQTYWLVLDTGTTWGSFYTAGASQNTYAEGQARLGSWASGGGTWNNTSPAGLDIYFRLNLGGQTSKIEGNGGPWNLSIGSDGGDAWAHEVSRTNTAGNIYCQVSEGNAGGKSCNMSRPDPSPVEMPISESQIESWKQVAEAGEVVNGNVSVNSQGAILGPVKINGNLTVGGGGTLLMTGPIWVTGDISVAGGGKINLDASYGSASEVLMADGLINLAGNAQFSGSGTAGSFPIVLSTSSCPDGPGCNGKPALYITGGSGAILLSAPNGTLELNGGSATKSLGAKKVHITGGGTINYEIGLADLSFTSGPSGGFQIVSWKEK